MKECYIRDGQEWVADTDYPYDDVDFRMLGYLKEHPWSKLEDIATVMELHKETIRRRLRVMLDYELVKCERDWYGNTGHPKRWALPSAEDFQQTVPGPKVSIESPRRLAIRNDGVKVRCDIRNTKDGGKYDYTLFVYLDDVLKYSKNMRYGMAIGWAKRLKSGEAPWGFNWETPLREPYGELVYQLRFTLRRDKQKAQWNTF